MGKVEKIIACAPRERREVAFKDFSPTRVLSAVVYDRAKDPNDDDKVVIAKHESEPTDIGFSLSAAMTIPKLLLNKKGAQAKKGEECKINDKIMVTAEKGVLKIA